jgi:hypothetical protein
MQWLTAVELGLLKGRHPLLKDVDVTINPSEGLALVEGRTSEKSDEVDKLWDLSQANALNGYTVDPVKDMLEDSDTAASIYLRSRRDSRGNSDTEDRGLQEVENGAVQQISLLMQNWLRRRKLVRKIVKEVKCYRQHKWL